MVPNEKVSFHKLSKTIFCCLISFPLLLLIFPIITLVRSSLTVFPTDDLANRISALNDSIWNGNSKIEEFAYDNKTLTLKYILKEGAASPLVFITLNLGAIDKPLDLSDYHWVSLRIKEATNKRIMIFIKTYLSGTSLPEPKNGHTLRHNQYILQLIPGRHQYRIKLEDFQTPAWWIEYLQVDQKLLPKESFQKVMTIDMQFNQEGSDYKINKPESITIEKISFHRSVSVFNYFLIGIIALYYPVIGGLLLGRSLKEKKEKFPKQRELLIPSYKERDLLQIKEFIETNYNSADISTRMVSESLGIPQSRVFELLKEEYGLTFKQLINKMRIDEAKRLLKETDFKIIDIALNLGFNNVSYFNNLFKMLEGETPSDYREKRMNGK